MKYLGKSLEELEQLVDRVGGELTSDEYAGRIATEGRLGSRMKLDVDMGAIDSRLRGFWGVHVGDPDEWLGILAADGYLYDKSAYAYEIKIGEPKELGGKDPFPVFTMEDPHVVDRTETPDSFILFAPARELPSSMFRLKKKYSEREVNRAREEVEARRGYDDFGEARVFEVEDDPGVPVGEAHDVFAGLDEATAGELRTLIEGKAVGTARIETGEVAARDQALRFRGASPSAVRARVRSASTNAIRQIKPIANETRIKLGRLIGRFNRGQLSFDDLQLRTSKVWREAYERVRDIGRGASGLSKVAAVIQPGVLREEENWYRSAIREELRYWNSFLEDIRSGKAEGGRMRQRLGNYVKALRFMYESARIVALPENNVLLYWMGPKKDDENICEGCVYMMERSPFTKSNIPAVPRDGMTPCLTNCRHRIVVRITESANDVARRIQRLPKRETMVRELREIKKRAGHKTWADKAKSAAKRAPDQARNPFAGGEKMPREQPFSVVAPGAGRFFGESVAVICEDKKLGLKIRRVEGEHKRPTAYDSGTNTVLAFPSFFDLASRGTQRFALLHAVGHWFRREYVPMDRVYSESDFATAFANYLTDPAACEGAERQRLAGMIGSRREQIDAWVDSAMQAVHRDKGTSVDESLAESSTPMLGAPYRNIRLYDVARILNSEVHKDALNLEKVRDLVERIIAGLAETIIGVEGYNEANRVNKQLSSALNFLLDRLELEESISYRVFPLTESCPSNRTLAIAIRRVLTSGFQAPMLVGAKETDMSTLTEGKKKASLKPNKTIKAEADWEKILADMLKPIEGEWREGLIKQYQDSAKRAHEAFIAKIKSGEPAYAFYGRGRMKSRVPTHPVPEFTQIIGGDTWRAFEAAYRDEGDYSDRQYRAGTAFQQQMVKEGKYKLDLDAAKKRAESQYAMARLDYISRNTKKLTGVTLGRQLVELETSIDYVGSIEGTLIVRLDGDDSFVARTFVKQNHRYSPWFTAYFQYPTTFHNVCQAGKCVKGAHSFDWLQKNFASASARAAKREADRPDVSRMPAITDQKKLKALAGLYDLVKNRAEKEAFAAKRAARRMYGSRGPGAEISKKTKMLGLPLDVTATELEDLLRRSFPKDAVARLKSIVDAPLTQKTTKEYRAVDKLLKYLDLLQTDYKPGQDGYWLRLTRGSYPKAVVAALL